MLPAAPLHTSGTTASANHRMKLIAYSRPDPFKPGPSKFTTEPGQSAASAQTAAVGIRNTLATEKAVVHASSSAPRARQSEKIGTMTLGSISLMKRLQPTAMSNEAILKASTALDAPSRQASTTSTASPVAGLSADRIVSPAAERATAPLLLSGSVTFTLRGAALDILVTPAKVPIVRVESGRRSERVLRLAELIGGFLGVAE